MKKDRKNRMFSLIALFLMLTTAVTFAAAPSTDAQHTKKTYAFIGANPNPVGVGQETLLHIGITEATGATEDGWKGLTVTVQKPDNTTQTLGPYTTDSTGGTGDIFVPTMEGTYYLQTHFPAQDYYYKPGAMFSPLGPAGGNVHYEASESEKLALVVTTEQLLDYPGVALPTEYWTRPIDSQAREWYTIAGSWVTIPPNRFAPYNEGPETAHVLWATPLTSGGLAGGELGLVGSGATSVGMETGDAYEGYFSNSVILNGKLYYNQYKSPMSAGTGIEEDVVCVDLHTGEELWVRNWNNTKLAFAQNFYWQSYNYQGTFPLLWTTEGGAQFLGLGPAAPEVWNAYDPFNGRWLYRMINVPAGTNVYGPNGAIYRYYTDLTNGWMMLWNTSAVVSKEGSFGSSILGTTFNVSMVDWNTRPSSVRGMMGPTAGYTNGYEWNKTIPTGLTGNVLATFLEDRMIGGSLSTGGATGTGNAQCTFWGINLKPGHEGELLFKKTWTPPAGNLTLLWGTASLEDGVFVVAAKEIRGLFGFSMDTGELLWGPTDPQHYLNVYTLGETRAIPRGVVIADGKVFSTGVAGIVYCYDAQTGELEWTYEAQDSYTESLFASNWWLNIAFITDGKIYLTHDEHSPNQPLPRGAPFVCLNATTGDVIWRADGLFRGTQWGGTGIIGDSIIATMDTYDMRIYAVGKGPSAITVAAPDVSVELGKSVVIKGTVTDVSPGTTEYALTARFPNGVPAVSEESQTEWMLYVYKQFPKPTNATGLPVTLSVTDANGNFREIGTTTSDASGFYSYQWTPDIDGKYTVYASFGGSKAYYGSSAVTAFVVDPVPQATQTAVPIVNLPPTEIYFAASTIAIIIAIAIVGLLLLKKKP